ncbi:HAD family hydrolase [Pediococcus parvulus]|uniref:HAD family hydrolase n=1 Tax=Pediococcus parvulus TaxID=54062 RepID=UPI00345E466F
MLNHKSTIFFDMDGLLLDTEKLYFETRRDVLENYGIPFTKEDHVAYIAKGFPVAIQKLTKLVGSADLGKRVFDEAMSLYNRRLQQGEVQVKKGAIELLKFLNQTHKRCYVTSSAAKDTIIQTTKITKIDQYFTDFISGDEVPHNKPAPDVYLYALQRTHADKTGTVVFEDSTSGVLSAVNAGLDVVLVPDWIKPQPTIQEKAVAVLPTLADAIPLLKKARTN